jgi:hypothetical protein
MDDMSVVSLDEGTKLKGLPKVEVKLDPLFQRTADQLQEIEFSQERLCHDCNDANNDIKRFLWHRENRLNYVTHIQDSSTKYWKLLGITVGGLLAIKAVQGGLAILSRFKRLRKNSSKTAETQQSKGVPDTETSQPRNHARAWNRGY